MGLTLVGYAVGLWFEIPGGLISFSASMTLLSIINREQGIDLYTWIAFFISILPAILYFVSWYFNSKFE
jgi:hypothetical protein